ncbi:MAG: hypothetical protein AAGI01_02110 [Myxococcota bacterium]
MPEVFATDGHLVRRVSSYDKKIGVQIFAHLPMASSIVERVERGVAPGVSLVGYSMFEDADRVAVLHTGKPGVPGWVAYPQDDLPNVTQRSLPANILDIPELRLVAGAGIYWLNRELSIHIALEQRGSAFAESEHAFHILDHIESLELRTVSLREGEPREVEVAKSATPSAPSRRVSVRRLEAGFPIEPSIYREFRHTERQIWLVVRFDRSMLLLPEEWRTFWMQVALHEPDGMLF